MITGITTGTTGARYFDDFLQKNYNTIRTDSQRICRNDKDFEDIFHNNLIKIRERIIASGFTATKYVTLEKSLYGYCWMSITNDYKLLKKREGKKRVIQILNDSEYSNVENGITQDDVNRFVDEHDKQLYYSQLEVLTKYVFKFLEDFYPIKQQYLFKRYLLTVKYNTYQKAVDETGYSLSFVKNTIVSIKKDLKLNLINYIVNDQQPECWKSAKHFHNVIEVSNKGRVRDFENKLLLNPTKTGVYKIYRNSKIEHRNLEQLITSVFQPNELIIYVRTPITVNKKMVFTDEQLELFDKPFNMKYWKEYRSVYNQLFKKNTANCNCNAGAYYNSIKNWLKMNNIK